jgi:hypothetical protein
MVVIVVIVTNERHQRVAFPSSLYVLTRRSQLYDVVAGTCTGWGHGEKLDLIPWGKSLFALPLFPFYIGICFTPCLCIASEIHPVIRDTSNN